MKRIDISGQRFGRLVAVERDGHLGNRTAWKFRCDCGAETRARTESVRGGLIQSCGCLRKEVTADRSTTHGHKLDRTPTRTYRAWCHAKERCFNPNTERYPHYGGRGITMNPEWADDFSRFLADLGECPEGMSIERIDRNGNYEPGNVRWATAHEQSRNRTDTVFVEHEGQQIALKDFAAAKGVKYKALHYLVKYKGLSPQDAATRLVYPPSSANTRTMAAS